MAAVDDFTSYEITDIRRAGLEFRTLLAGDLQLAPQERFGVVDRIDALQLQNQAALVGPEFFQFNLAALVILTQCEETHARRKTVGKAGVQLDSDFAMAALRFQNAGERNKVVVDGRSPELQRLR
jgi:hypothetical protein